MKKRWILLVGGAGALFFFRQRREESPLESVSPEQYIKTLLKPMPMGDTPTESLTVAMAKILERDRGDLARDMPAAVAPDSIDPMAFDGFPAELSDLLMARPLEEQKAGQALVDYLESLTTDDGSRSLQVLRLVREYPGLCPPEYRIQLGLRTLERSPAEARGTPEEHELIVLGAQLIAENTASLSERAKLYDQISLLHPEPDVQNEIQKIFFSTDGDELSKLSTEGS